jgi:hypothetical protein
MVLGPARLREVPGKPSKSGFQARMILKMNFNFNFKDSLPAPRQSIRRLTTARD